MQLRRVQNLKYDEYYCPMCRQLCNSVLPIQPVGSDLPVVAVPSDNPVQIIHDLAKMYQQVSTVTVSDSVTYTAIHLIYKCSVSSISLSAHYTKYNKIDSLWANLSYTKNHLWDEVPWAVIFCIIYSIEGFATTFAKVFLKINQFLKIFLKLDPHGFWHANYDGYSELSQNYC